MKEKEKNMPFPMQAARFSFWAPIVAIILNVVTSAATADSREARMVVGVICSSIILLGFGFAIYSLVSMRKHGKKGILGYGIAGLIFNGIIVASVIAMIPVLQKGKEQAENQFIIQTVEEISKECPKMIDPITRVESATLTGDKRVTIRFTITAFTADEIDMERWNKQMVPTLKQNIEQSVFGTLLSRGVLIEYEYFGNQGKRIANVSFDPNDYHQSQ